jgi:adenosylmethionine-8-amino-7-oxononanoate aminotransferase
MNHPALEAPRTSSKHDDDATPQWPLVPRSVATYARAEGAYLFTAGGRRVLDAASGAIVANIGHGRRRVARVAAEALERLTYVHPDEVTRTRLALVKTLREAWLGPVFTRMMFTTGGGEAIEAAVKGALHYHAFRGNLQKRLIVAQEVGYHGATYYAYSLSNTSRVAPEVRDFLEPVPRIASPGGRSASELFASFRSRIEALGVDRIAAIVAEPIVGSSGGVLVPPVGYWEAVRAYCRANDILLVFDEVMTGFGRTGAPFAFNTVGAVPDILVAGKGLGCGYAPICGVFFAEQVAEAIVRGNKVIVSPTYGAHEMSCAVALECLRILDEEDLVERACAMGNYLGARLERCRSLPAVSDVRGTGLLWAVELAVGRPEDAKAVLETALDQLDTLGIAAYPAGRSYVRPSVLIAPPFVVGGGEIDTIADGLFEVLSGLEIPRAHEGRK